jgi:hypothetical protein
MILHSLLFTASLAFGALTPAKVSNVTPNPSALPAAKAPAVIYVDRFPVNQTASQPSSNDTSDDEQGGGLFGNRPHLLGRLRGDNDDTILGLRHQEQHDETLAKLPRVLQKALVENLSKSIAPAVKGDGSDSTRGWLITGQFLVIDLGSRALQAGVGFGAGQSQVQVQVQIYSLRDRATPFLVFDSKGASGHMPGAVMMMNPYVAAAKFVMSKKEPEKEAKKIAKSIAEEIGKFMAAQGIPTLKSENAAPVSPASTSSSKGNR